jgi:class 3 adenylate cyclase
VETSTGRLYLVRAVNVVIRADRSMTDLYRTRFEGRPPKVRSEADTVTLEYPRFGYSRPRPYRSTITLNGSVAWRIESRGGLTGLTADLAGITLQALDGHKGATRIVVTLPRPAGEVPIQFSGGVNEATFHRPVGVATRVRVGSGASGLTLDDQHFKAVGGSVNWQTPDWDGASDRYDITIFRGARALTVDTLEAPAPPPGRTGRVLATVVFTDIVGSTDRAREAGDRRWRELLDRHDAAAVSLAAERGGELIKTTGDGVLAVFDRPGEGIEFARAFRREVRGLGLDIRAGLHAGEVEYRGTDVGGIGVHIGSRVMDAAAPGEILVSRTVRDLAAGSGLDLEDRGTHPLRGVGDDWQLFAVR